MALFSKKDHKVLILLKNVQNSLQQVFKKRKKSTIRKKNRSITHKPEYIKKRSSVSSLFLL